VRIGTASSRRPIRERRRGLTESEDAALRAELLASGKDAAELLMIVDLERNDLGRVSVAGSVQVGPFPEIERYSTVSHLVATVRGSLRAGAGPADVLRATFPGGSITGAPKIRAMEILEQLEPMRRKFAMGSLLAWDFTGRLDSSILIRSLVARSGEAVFHVGAGIVADSVPEEEYLETVAKAAPLMAALEQSP
jgi:para-aminobenzoate synthetase component 1